MSDISVLSGWWKCPNPKCNEPHTMLVTGSPVVLCILLERMGFTPADATAEPGMVVIKNDDSYLTMRPAMSADRMLAKLVAD